MAERKTYTEEQKAEILKKAEETSIAAASKEFGVSRATVMKWKAAAGVTAEVIEAKKTVRKTAKKAKTATKAKVEKKKADAKEAVDAVAAKVDDDVTAAKIAAKKTTRKAGRKVKETVENAAKTPSVKKPGAKLNLVFQSTMGGAVTPEQIAKKLPKEASDAYVKIEENRIYYVLKDGSTGSIEIWE